MSTHHYFSGGLRAAMI